MRRTIGVALAILLIGVTAAPAGAEATPALIVKNVVVNDDFGEALASDFAMVVVARNKGRVVEFAGSEAGTKVFLNPGDSYSVQEPESIELGYQSTLSADCSGTIAAGETKACTVTSDDITPVLVVRNSVVNDNGGEAAASDFTMHVERRNGKRLVVRTFPGSETGTAVFPHDLSPGDTYRVEESGPPGYTASSSADCSGTIEVGVTKTCTLTSDDVPGKTTPTLIVKNVVINDDFGAAVASDFSTVVIVKKSRRVVKLPGSEAGTKVFLNPGDSYRVHQPEPVELGYDRTLSADCSGTIKAGQRKTCTVTNNDITPIMRVDSHVVNDNGGEAAPGDFTVNVVRPNGKRRVLRTFPGSEAGTLVFPDPRDLRPGNAYRIEQSGPSGYSASFSAGCSGRIDLGVTKTCTVTNDDLPGERTPALIVNNVVVNDDFGEALASDFSMVVVVKRSGRVVKIPGSEAGTKVFLNPGDSYSVHESQSIELGYDSTLSTECSGTIAAGETRTCTVTSDDITPVLVVHNLVDNNDGGAATPSDFTLKVLRTVGRERVVRKFAGSESGTPVFAHDLRPGDTYRVAVSGPFGYAASPSVDCSGTIELGATKTCTLTNDDPGGG